MLKTVPFKRTVLASMLTLASSAISAAYAAPATSTTTAPEQNNTKPNIVVIFGDDVGYWNLSTSCC